MSSRQKILDRVRANKPQVTVVLPDVSRSRGFPDVDLASRFTSEIESAGARVIDVSTDAGRHLDNVLMQQAADYSTVAAHGVDLAGSIGVDDIETEADFDGIELFVCRGRLAVAENGAIWIDDDLCGRRATLFLSEHVMVVLEKSTIVPTLHEAYDQLDVSGPGFGIFVAGPSKTADIEQSLVIGAHGPRSLGVILTD